ncbi:MAG: DNA-directed RNA polymerase [Methanosarcina thermophila]|mgnify:CR=1 FL=1|jgi:DNA-directed RNA polymerase subunit E'|uniref:DNA-directed RNA polymerase subunit Rpo7 n=3 Tax=Methanosarcina thermophila TaxID=2210 RepID=A0A1I7B559_METTE|nr:DNA-directed RNA polymerase [Methanosarcina thermophila]ALK05380.1 MAG: DNA-directed RNA polymerase subunit E' [Methanosarcina sp. 795]AKB14178.1 DNA-directed RNA polymerase subunit E' [Methanosarcina thermophila TM-1]AKB15180.1 DNA-directed RNA polymerase subunit E' [Methanosarcina thermophila CHTI-55]NLU58366.1 DNA-directed RNA polymerase [Methanosarcina thermophila]SFT82288.1 DNA-directed RNA polymerase, subunit E' [Methanosarcina thermophila]
MYKMMKLVDTVRIPPTLLGEEVEPTVKNALREKLEGQVDKKLGCLVAIHKIVEIGEGHILVGDGAVYYDVTFEAIMFVPELQEIIEGEVVEAVSFGVFVGIGPMDGLLHVSQITDDFISYDAKNARLVTRNGNKSIAEGDHVRARIVAVSINEREPKESKIGLTMRQTALGKLQWLEEARKRKQPSEAAPEGTA